MAMLFQATKLIDNDAAKHIKVKQAMINVLMNLKLINFTSERQKSIIEIHATMERCICFQNSKETICHYTIYKNLQPLDVYE